MPVLLETDDINAVNGLYLDGNDSGNAIAAWEQSDGSQVSVWVNRRTAAAGWRVRDIRCQSNARHARIGRRTVERMPNDIEYFGAACTAAEGAGCNGGDGIEGRLLHPLEPRTLRLGARISF